MSASQPSGVPPRPSIVPGNRWNQIAVPDLNDWHPRERVSVVIPHFESPAALQVCLEGLNAQSYPEDLLQVIVVDDGSSSEPSLPPHLRFEAKVATQERQGFGAARARNLGASLADGTILLFLDCDHVTDRHWVSAHARWHHVVSDAVTVGFRSHLGDIDVDPEAVREASAGGALASYFSDMRPEPSDYLEWHLERTADLTSADDDIFRVVTGGNLGLRKDTFSELGGFDGSFTQWGGEDTEFGYRAFARGLVLVPERRADVWHMGRIGGLHDPDKIRSLYEQRAKMAHLIAHRTFRSTHRGRSFVRPRLAVGISAEDRPASEVDEVVGSVLAGDFHDLVVRLGVPADHPERTWLERQFSPDPRVDLAADAGTIADYALSPLHLHLPPLAKVSSSTIEEVVARLESATRPVGVLRIELPGIDPQDALAEAFSARAWHRATRLDPARREELIADLFGEDRCSGADIGFVPLGASDEGDAYSRPAPEVSYEPDIAAIQRRVMSLSPRKRAVLLGLAWRAMKLAQAGGTLLRARSGGAVVLAFKQFLVGILPASLLRFLKKRTSG